MAILRFQWEPSWSRVCFCLFVFCFCRLLVVDF